MSKLDSLAKQVKDEGDVMGGKSRGIAMAGTPIPVPMATQPFTRRALPISAPEAQPEPPIASEPSASILPPPVAEAKPMAGLRSRTPQRRERPVYSPEALHAAMSEVMADVQAEVNGRGNLCVSKTIKLDKDTCDMIDQLVGARGTNGHIREAISFGLKNLEITEVDKARVAVSMGRTAQAKKTANNGPGRTITVGVSNPLYDLITAAAGQDTSGKITEKAWIEAVTYLYTRALYKAMHPDRAAAVKAGKGVRPVKKE